MAYKASAAKYKQFNSFTSFKDRMKLKEAATLRHNVKGGYYTKNHLNMITWHAGGQQRLVVLNDADGSDWAKIKKEK